jgi:hypothetical protein
MCVCACVCVSVCLCVSVCVSVCVLPRLHVGQVRVDERIVEHTIDAKLDRLGRNGCHICENGASRIHCKEDEEVSLQRLGCQTRARSSHTNTLYRAPLLVLATASNTV